MNVRPELRAEISGAIVETPVRPVVSRHRFVKIVALVWILWFVCLLSLVAGMSKVAVQ
jgi:hypothetical protein